MSTRYRKVHVSLSSLSMLSSKLLGFPQHSRLPPSFSKVLLPTTWLRICQASHLHARLQYGFCPSLLHCLPLGSCWGFSLSARVFFSFKLWQNCAWPSTFWFSFNLLCIVFCLHSSLHVSRRHHILLQRVRPTTWLLGIELWTPRKTVLLTFEPSLQPPNFSQLQINFQQICKKTELNKNKKKTSWKAWDKYWIQAHKTRNSLVLNLK